MVLHAWVGVGEPGVTRGVRERFWIPHVLFFAVAISASHSPVRILPISRHTIYPQDTPDAQQTTFHWCLFPHACFSFTLGPISPPTSLTNMCSSVITIRHWWLPMLLSKSYQLKMPFHRFICLYYTHLGHKLLFLDINGSNNATWRIPCHFWYPHHLR